MTSLEIRQAYIDFFVQKHGHTFVPSSPVVPHDDPTLLFTNAGMNQFKPIFLGQEKREYTRAVNTQKCIRAGGKHNDLDDVGRSRRHHTFFEMLGNWSFGDYFKRGAIEMSWELLTKVWKLDPERLHVTCFEGDEANGVPRDTEAAKIWKEVAGLPDDHIHYFGKDNFWEMGDTGPCGPCTEIYYDRTPDKTGGPLVNGEDPRVMEIWNNVFIQYNRNADRTLVELPAQHVDTGMGFERITQVLQNVDSNYSIDLFNPFWAKLKELSGHTYGGKFPKTNSVDAAAEAADEGLRKDIAFRVIADHIRCLTFALTDGALPSNEGRGYVLRRILRRAVRFGRQQLGLQEPFLFKFVDVVVTVMGDAFPELKKNPQNVADLIKDEEVSFGKTLGRGLMLFEEAAATARAHEYEKLFDAEMDGIEIHSQNGGGKSGYDVRTSFIFEKLHRKEMSESEVSAAILNKGGSLGRITGSSAFKLHDTYGFPIDLTRIMAEERGMTVDIAGYEKLMEQAKEIARAGGKDQSGKKLTELPPAILADLDKQGVKPTDDSAKFSSEPISAKIMAIWDGEELNSPVEAGEDEQLAIILDRTNFYAEMGGQVGDAGTITAPTSLDLGETKRAGASVFDVETTKIVGGYVLHIGRLRSGKMGVGETVTLTVKDDRNATQKNHTTTHLANWALRETLGEGVQQKGSLVDPDKLRFDFSHGKALADAEIEKVETLVNEAIAKNLPVSIDVVPQEQALKINGLRAVFGEKYPPKVRVVSVGANVADLLKDPSNAKWRNYSIEFCGGTHLTKSGEAEGFAIVAEESVSKGIRRLTALTGEPAKSAKSAGEALLRSIEAARASQPENLTTAIASIQQQIGDALIPLRIKRQAQAAVVELQTKLKQHEKSQAAAGSAINIAAVATELEKQGDTIVASVPEASDEQLRNIMNTIRKRRPSHAILLAAVAGAKVSFIAMVSDDRIAAGLSAGDWVREAAKVAGGGGGGKPQMAQAGGKDPSKLEAALEAARTFAASKTGA